MNIVIIGENDWAAVGFHLSQAINRCTDHHAVQFVQNFHRLRLPYDKLIVAYNRELLKRELNNADFILYGSSCYPFQPRIQTNKGIEVLDIPIETKKGIWHGGSDYRIDYERYNELGKQVDIVFAHEGLCVLHPDNVPLQQPFNVMDYDIPIRENKIPVIGHSPSSTDKKGTKHFFNALDKLKEEKYEFEVELIKDCYWSEGLERKKRCDIFFDQIMTVPNPGNAKRDYGLSLVEAATFGCACLDGSDLKTPALKVRNENEIYNSLVYIINDEERYHKRRSKEMRKWAEANHSYEVVSKYFIEKIEEVM